MFLRVEDNPNCETLEGRVFSERGSSQAVHQVLRWHAGQERWCDVIAWGPEGPAGPAQVCKVDDSGDGTCFLLYGGPWGLRLRDASDARRWSLDQSDQWGEAFLLLPPDEKDLRLSPASHPQQT